MAVELFRGDVFDGTFELQVNAHSSSSGRTFVHGVLGCVGTISAPAAGLNDEQLAATSRLQKILARVDGCSGPEQNNARYLMMREFGTRELV